VRVIYMKYCLHTTVVALLPRVQCLFAPKLQHQKMRLDRILAAKVQMTKKTYYRVSKNAAPHHHDTEAKPLG